jgi:hypothetical protein
MLKGYGVESLWEEIESCPKESQLPFNIAQRISSTLESFQKKSQSPFNIA